MTSEILHPESNVRILRPSEVRKLIDAIPKNINRERFEVLLFTGCRYTELVDAFGKKERIDGKFLKIKNTKAKVKEKFRYVRLNNQGLRAVDYFMRHEKPLPSYVTWNENLNRWSKKAHLDPKGISVKTTRKTWESWLVTMYPMQITQIFLSMGHESTTALKHYLQLPFTEQDKEDMKYYTDGWI